MSFGINVTPLVANDVDSTTIFPCSKGGLRNEVETHSLFSAIVRLSDAGVITSSQLAAAISDVIGTGNLVLGSRLPLKFSMLSTPAALTSTSETDFNTSIASYTSSANSVLVGDVLELALAGLYSGTVLPSLRLKLYIGSIAAIDHTIAGGLVAATDYAWNARCFLTARTIGVTANAQVEGALNFQTSSTTALNVLVPSQTKVIDTTIPNLIKVSVQWGSGGTGQSLSLTSMYVQKVSV